MANMITHVRGFAFKYIVDDSTSRMVLINDFSKHNINEVVESNGTYYLQCSDTTGWEAGKYKYQILNASGIVDEGEMVIKQNYALADTTNFKTHWQTILDAVEATIGGRATDAQLSITVGDKHLSYCSLAELLDLRNFVLEKAAEEKEALGEKISTKNDEHRIKYVWR